MGRLADGLRSWLGPYFSSDREAMLALFGGTPTASGEAITEATALNLSAVWCAVVNIASAVAALPLSLYKRLDDEGKEPFIGHPLYKLVHARPNAETSTFVFRETLTAHALTWGNGYAEIQRDSSGRPVALWQLTPDRVEPYRENGTLRYRVTNGDGQQVTLAADRLLHLPGLGWDGVRGYSVVARARETMGLARATEKYGAQFFANGAVSSLVAMHPGTLSATAQQNLKTSIAAAIGGAQKHGVLVLEEGLKVEKISIPPDDAQFLESRKFSVTEIARWFNIPPHKLKDLERATYSNIEMQSQEYVDDTLMPWLLRWEQELDAKLIRPLESTQQFFKHNVKARLRGDTAARAAWYANGRQWGWYSANDVLRIEDENPIGPQGDIYLVPSNMAPADRLNDVIDAQIEPPKPELAPSSGPSPDEQAAHLDRLADMIATRLRPELTAPAQLHARLDETRTAHAARVAGLLPSLREVIEAAVRKEVHYEANRARKAAQSPERLRAWMDAFYATRAAACVDLLLPAMRLHFMLVGRAEDAETETRRIIGAQIAESRTALTGLLEAPPEPFTPAVDAVVARWEATRPAAVMAALLQEAITHGQG